MTRIILWSTFIFMTLLTACKEKVRPKIMGKSGEIINYNYKGKLFNNTIRNIRVYLPPEYQKSSKSYPALYFMDGQNLFYDSTSFAGEWHIDETMDKLISENYPPAVIVGIDHANEKRINEYNPYDHPEYGEGQGKDFMRWFVDYFIPEIEKSFRIESNKKVRGIGGSSMGGLISLYGISSYPEIFGHAALFSVSFPISPQSLELIDYISEESNIYLAAGEKEPKSLVNQTQEAADELLAYIFPKKNLRLNIIADKGHNEQLWDELFIDYYKWISKKWQKP